jgi:N-glycosylase/DNA lyase
VHGWVNLFPFSWDSKKNTLRFAALVENQPIDMEAKQSGEHINATLNSHRKLSGTQKDKARELIKRSLSLDADTSELLKFATRAGPRYVDLIEKGAGRLLRSPTLWEDAAKTLFTTNCSWAMTKKMCDSICAKTFTNPTPSGGFPFPTAKTVSSYEIDELQDLMPVGYRGSFLKDLAQRFAEDPTYHQLETNGYDYGTADKMVRNLKGFADYATAHLLILAGYCNEIPIDTVVTSYLKKNHKVRKPKSFIDRHYRKWGKYKWWGFKLEKMLNQQNWLGD